MATVGDVVSLCDRLWPPAWAEPWDNVGLLVGARGDSCTRCVCALDADAETLRGAVEAGAELLLAHHPLPFRPLRRVTEDDPAAAAVLLAARLGVAVYAAHTNFDVHPGGVSRALAAALDVRPERVLEVRGHESLFMLAVQVPLGHEEAVRRALAEAGAGRSERYAECSFSVEGTGAFRPLAGARPFLGEPGELSREAEVRVTVVVPQGRRAAAVRAMLEAHPYEEVAYDLVRLENEGPERGLGILGALSRGWALQAFAANVARRLRAPATRFVGVADREVRRVALCGGAGMDCAVAALEAGADVLVTGDCRYHEAREAEARGLALIDPGHQATEAPAVAVMAEAVRAAAAAAGLGVEVGVTPPREDVWRAVAPAD